MRHAAWLAVLALGCSASVEEAPEQQRAPLGCAIVVWVPGEPPACPGRAATIECSEPIADPMTTRCPNTLTASGDAPCSVVVGQPVSGCYETAALDGRTWCCWEG